MKRNFNLWGTLIPLVGDWGRWGEDCWVHLSFLVTVQKMGIEDVPRALATGRIPNGDPLYEHEVLFLKDILSGKEADE
jgi:hypothetical protein